MSSLHHAPLVVTLCALLGIGCNSAFGIEQGKPRPICADPLMIDDMEVGEGSICESEGRSGFWFTDSDPSSEHLTPGKNVSFEPTRIEDGSRGTSRYAARLSGFDFTEWGALMGLVLNQQGSGRAPFPATNMTGVKFWMRSNVPVGVLFDLPETEGPDFAGHCVDSATEHNCFNHFGFQISAPSQEWTEYEVPFDALRQLQFGGTATFNPSLLLGLQFKVGPYAPFDVWVDDIRFYYECKTPLCLPTCADPAFPKSCPARGHYAASSCMPPGTDCAEMVNWCADPLLIDDLEDGDAAICESGGRSGGWWSNSDGSSGDLQPPAIYGAFKPTLIEEGRGASHYAARLSGSGFTGWGALMGFNPSDYSKQGYDASGNDGLTFWMKSNGPVRVGFQVPATIPISQKDAFGTCDDSAAGASCNNHFGFALAAAENEWLEYRVPFAALRQELSVDRNFNWVAPNATWDPTTLKAVFFQPDAASEFDVWVDDVRFYSCDSADCVPTCRAADAPVACPASRGRPADCWPKGTDCSSLPEVVSRQGVWGSGRDDVWTVGAENTTWTGRLSHWDGLTWTTVSTAPASMIWSVWGSAGSDVWAVGDQGVILRNQGSGWLANTSASAQAGPINDIWGSGANDVWAVGSAGTILRWNGSIWSPSPSGTSVRLNGVWGSGPKDIWAVGFAGTIVHWNGRVWSPVASATTSQLRDVWGSASDDVWAVGLGGVMVHWDGAVWTRFPLAMVHHLVAVWGSAESDVWAVGFGGTIIHWDGSRWTPFPSGTSNDFSAVWGSQANDVWAVSYAGTIAHWDGKVWSSALR